MSSDDSLLDSLDDSLADAELDCDKEADTEPDNEPDQDGDDGMVYDYFDCQTACCDTSHGCAFDDLVFKLQRTATSSYK